MSTKRKRKGEDWGSQGRGEGIPARRPGRPEKPLERVPYSFEEIIRALVKPVPKQK